MEVHKIIGNRFQEVIYQRTLAIELELQGLHFAHEQEMPIFYKGHRIGLRRFIFLLRKKVLVGLKATIQLEGVHLAQAINYLEAFRLNLGLLINFGSKSLQFRRVMKGLCRLIK